MKCLLTPLMVLTLLPKADAHSMQSVLSGRQFTITESLDTTKQKTRHSVFIEGLGNGFWGSINYMTTFPLKNNFFINTRFGVFYINSKKLFYPYKTGNTEISLRYGSRNAIALGVGISYVYGNGACKDCEPSYVSETVYFTVKPIEYIFQRKSYGFFFSTSALLFIQIHEYNNFVREHSKELYTMPVIPFIGFSIGYTFKNIEKNIDFNTH